jgi:chromate reductase
MSFAPMAAERRTSVQNIIVLVGSFRRASLNQRLAQALGRLALDRLRFSYADISALPHYNTDLWSTPPRVVLDFKRGVQAADGVLIVTPEYNRSIPGVLKNALDWGSRPEGQGVWEGKPVAICGATPGRLGTEAAQSHLRSILPILGMYLTARRELYLTLKDGLISDNFDVGSETTRAILSAFIHEFADWIDFLSAGKVVPGAEPASSLPLTQQIA